MLHRNMRGDCGSSERSTHCILLQMGVSQNGRHFVVWYTNGNQKEINHFVDTYFEKHPNFSRNRPAEAGQRPPHPHLDAGEMQRKPDLSIPTDRQVATGAKAIRPQSAQHVLDETPEIIASSFPGTINKSW